MVLLTLEAQPIVLLVISAVVGGFMMFIYSGLLILINRRTLPAPIRIRGVRLGMLIWAIVLFGTLSVLTFRAQIERCSAAADRRPPPGRPGLCRFPTLRGKAGAEHGLQRVLSARFPRSVGIL